MEAVFREHDRGYPGGVIRLTDVDTEYEWALPSCSMKPISTSCTTLTMELGHFTSGFGSHVPRLELEGAKLMLGKVPEVLAKYEHNSIKKPTIGVLAVVREKGAEAWVQAFREMEGWKLIRVCPSAYGEEKYGLCYVYWMDGSSPEKEVEGEEKREESENGAEEARDDEGRARVGLKAGRKKGKPRKEVDHEGD